MHENANVYKHRLCVWRMINRPTESELLKLAGIKSGKNRPHADRVIHMHFFLDGHSWYMSEYDPKSRRFFGYTIPNDEYHNARWDYFSFDDLCRMRTKAHGEVVRNTHWNPRRAIEVDRIRDVYAWRESMGEDLGRAK